MYEVLVKSRTSDRTQSSRQKFWRWSQGQGTCRNWGQLRNGKSFSRWLVSMVNVRKSKMKARFQWTQGVKHKNLMGKDLDSSHRWKDRQLHVHACSVPHLVSWLKRLNSLISKEIDLGVINNEISLYPFFLSSDNLLPECRVFVQC